MTDPPSSLSSPQTDEAIPPKSDDEIVEDTRKHHHHRSGKSKDKDKDKNDDEKSHRHHRHRKHTKSPSRKEAAAAEAAAKDALFERKPRRSVSRSVSQQSLSKSTSFASLLSSLKPHSRTASLGGDVEPPTPVLHYSENSSDWLKDLMPGHMGESVGPRVGHKKAQSFQVNAVGEVVYKKHPSWVLMHQMQIGIYHSLCFTVPRLVENAIKTGVLKKRPDKVLDEDPCITDHAFYDTPEILRFPATGSILHSTPPHKLGDFKFKDYCPLAFRWIRSFFGIKSPLEFLGSLCGYHVNKLGGNDEEEGNPLRLMGTPGKSGSLFFFTEDMKYCIKTIPKHEAKLLRKILPPYVKHLNDNPNTLLPRFYGLYRVKPHRGSQVRFVVMSNLFATNLLIHERFDLKGSDVGRYTSQAERTRKGRLATLKEHNWKEMKRCILFSSPSSTMTSDTCTKALFMDQLRRDTQFLADQGLMDYSLLVGFHYHKLQNKEKGTGVVETRSRAASDALRAISSAELQPRPYPLVKNPSISSRGSDYPVSLPCSPRGEPPPNSPPPPLIISESMINKKLSKRKGSVDATVPTSSLADMSEPKKSDSTSTSDAQPKKHKSKKSSKSNSDAVAAAAATTTTTTTSTTTTTTTTTTSTTTTNPNISNKSSKKIPHVAVSPKYSLSAMAAAGAAAESNKKGIEDDPNEGVFDLPDDVAIGGDEQEFLTMRMNLQPHTGQVEQFNVEGIGDVDIVTMPFDDYSIQSRDLWPNFGTPGVHYSNLWYRDNGGMYSAINGISYFFGIIDILMLYTPRKSIERRVKTIRYHGQGEVSSCPPNRYAIRFLSFINSATL